MKRLLDTNAYVALRRGDDTIADVVRKSSQLVFSMVVYGELLFGFRHGNRYQKNLEELDDFLSQPSIALQEVTRTTADRFGRIAADLRRAGTPIPTNDIWIAAQAMETGAEIVTFDRHFDNIRGLPILVPKQT